LGAAHYYPTPHQTPRISISYAACAADEQAAVRPARQCSDQRRPALQESGWPSLRLLPPE
jgi:hypothetical protein